MDRNIAIAFAEIDEILNYMDEQYQKRIPKKLRKLISNNKSTDYNIVINPNIPLTEQNISRKALSILSVINYNYWCIEEKQKEILIEKYRKNEIVKQEKLRELYNPDNLFKEKKQINKIENTDKQLIVYHKKENIFAKIINKLKAFFNLT